MIFFSSLYANQNETEQRIEYELDAAQYIKPMRNLFVDIAQTRGMTNTYLNGDDTFKQKVLNKRKAVDKHFSRLLAIHQTNEAMFELQGEPNTLSREWQRINANAFNLPAHTVFTQYTDLIARIIDLMDTISREGKMAQDPDASNSFLINSLIHTLPNQIESLGKLRGKGAGILSSNALTTDNKLAIGALADNRNSLKLKKDIEYLFRSSPELSSVLSNDFNDANVKLNRYLALANTAIIQASDVSIEATEFFAQGTDTISQLLRLYDVLLPTLQNRMSVQVNAAQQTLYFYFGLMILCVLILIYTYVGIYLGIRTNLNALSHVANEVCDGNLDARLKLETKDELAAISTSINEIVEGISRSIITVKSSSENIAKTALRIETESQSAAEGMNLQSQELTMTSTAITEMSASVNEVAKNAEVGAEAANTANDYAETGREIVQKSLNSIDVLANNIEHAVSGVNELEENSNSITSILDVISGIADQTNLLALNAAIEAARAGEQGRGFAVVADEVRTLAQRTQTSTIEIKSVIEAIQSGISHVSKAMMESQEHANTAVSHSKEAGNALAEITGAVNDITNMSTQIATAAEEQSCVSDEVAMSIVKISDVAQDASRGSQALAQAGAQLSAMSKEMSLMVSRYSINETAFEQTEQQLNLITWQSRYELGVEEIDRQHRKLVEMMNELHILSSKGRGAGAIATALDNLINFTEVHFTFEEDYFDRHHYPKSSAHKAEHRKLISELRAHQNTIKSGGTAAIDEQLELLNEWLTKHIQYSDLDYVNHIKMNNDKG